MADLEDCDEESRVVCTQSLVGQVRRGGSGRAQDTRTHTPVRFDCRKGSGSLMAFHIHPGMGVRIVRGTIHCCNATGMVVLGGGVQEG